MLKLYPFVVLLLIISNNPAFNQMLGDYRSSSTGSWHTASTWETYNGISWVAASTPPDHNSGTITIRSGHTVTISSDLQIDQTIINVGGTVALNSGATLTIKNGTGTDLDVSGVLKSSGDLVEEAGHTIIIQSGGKYQHNHTTDNGSFPTATWDSNSTCEIIGYTTASGEIPNSINQTYGNFTWDCPNQTSDFNLNSRITNVNGIFSVISTGTGSLMIAVSAATFSFHGYSQSGGSIIVASSSHTETVNISTNVSLTGGTLELCSSSGSAYLYIAGNYSHTAGTLTNGGTGISDITFNKSGVQTFISGGTVTNAVNFIVNSGSTLEMGNSIMTGGGTFTLSAGATLNTGSSEGISTSGSTGSIQVTGTRSFGSSSNYGYDGSTLQNTGSGLPSTVNNLTISNTSAPVVLSGSLTVTGTLNLNGGNIQTSSHTLTLGSGTSQLGALNRTSGTIIGNFKRWFSASVATNILFPVGTSNYYRPANISFTVAPTTGGTLTAYFTASNPGTNGLPLTDADLTVVQNIGADGYWTITAGDGLSGGTYSLDLTAEGFEGVQNYLKLRILKRSNSSSPWTLNGVHLPATGSNSSPVAHRIGMSGFSDFAIGSDSENPMPVEITSFTASVNGSEARLLWSTAWELNNRGFEVERKQIESLSQSDWQIAGFVQGKGTTNTRQDYTFQDKKLNVGKYKYRLKQMDFNGNYEYFLLNGDVTIKNPGEFSISQNYPNPSNPKTKIDYQLPFRADVKIKVYDITGQEVASIIDEVKEAGYHSAEFDGSNLASGVYFYRIVVSGEQNFTRTMKMALIK